MYPVTCGDLPHSPRTSSRELSFAHPSTGRPLSAARRQGPRVAAALALPAVAASSTASRASSTASRASLGASLGASAASRDKARGSEVTAPPGKGVRQWQSAREKKAWQVGCQPRDTVFAD
jgi:hypothetical protein